uniref:Amino acid transporter family protein n=2 Tax=Populus alba TaxID=43335 RepID=A0A4U5R5T0_POPAL|nr:amino acid transporter family protein [Populus alba]
MKNSVSDQSFYIESEEEDEENELGRNGQGEEDNNESDSDNSLADDNRQQSKTGLYNTSWPQSYRQSIDLYSSVPSPNLTFLGTPTLSRLGSSFLSSSLTRRYTPESLPSVVKPLLQKPEEEQLPSQRRSSRSLLAPITSRRSSVIRKDEKPSQVSHELPMSRQSSFGQAVLNGLNVLEPGLETYPDIGQAAFGTTGRFVISIILYVELYACCVEYIILESDNLSSLFPNAHISLGGFEMDSHHLFALMTTLAVLPTVWLRDLSVLSYISAGGVVASVLVVLSLFWVGLVDNVGIHSKGTVLNLGSLPVAIGLYGYCYSGHAVFPNIYTSMAQPSRFPTVLLACFSICTLMYAGVAYMGYTMFGESTESQFTLNLPQDLVVSKIAVWTTVVNPFTKYALTMSPVAMSLEELIPSNHMKSHMYAICIRTALVFSTLLVGLAIPFFGLVMSLIGSLLTMLVTLILPCACFLSIVRGKATRFQGVVCIIIIAVGIVSSAFGTHSALSKIIENLSS